MAVQRVGEENRLKLVNDVPPLREINMIQLVLK